MAETYPKNNPTSLEPQPSAGMPPGNSDDPPLSPHVAAQIESRTDDRFSGIVFDTYAQVNLENLFKSLIVPDLTGPTFRREISESLTVDNNAQPDIKRNYYLYRRITLVLQDVRDETASHAA